MTVPSVIADLSTTAGSNSPAGSDTPTQGDDFLRALSAFIAQLRDQLNGTSSSGTLKTPVFSGNPTGTVTSNSYTPTLTNAQNITGSTAFQCQYMRVGNVVTVSGLFAMAPTSGATITRLGISLPVASNFATVQNCGGSAVRHSSATPLAAGIWADATNDRAEVELLLDADANNWSWSFSFTYLVI